MAKPRKKVTRVRRRERKNIESGQLIYNQLLTIL